MPKSIDEESALLITHSNGLQEIHVEIRPKHQLQFNDMWFDFFGTAGSVPVGRGIKEHIKSKGYKRIRVVSRNHSRFYRYDPDNKKNFFRGRLLKVREKHYIYVRTW